MKRKSLILALIIVFTDQMVKLAIDNSMTLGESEIVIRNFLSWTKVYNYGASWSMFSGMQNMLIGISILSFICLIYYQDFFKVNIRNILAYALIYGGLFGNLIDRVTRGYVIDYIQIKHNSFNFPIFNIADIVLVVGFFLIIYSVIKGDDKHGIKSGRKRHKTR